MTVSLKGIFLVCTERNNNKTQAKAMSNLLKCQLNFKKVHNSPCKYGNKNGKKGEILLQVQNDLFHSTETISPSLPFHSVSSPVCLQTQLLRQTCVFTEPVTETDQCVYRTRGHSSHLPLDAADAGLRVRTTPRKAPWFAGADRYLRKNGCQPPGLCSFSL